MRKAVIGWSVLGLLLAIAAAIWWTGRRTASTAPVNTVWIHSLECKPEPQEGSYRLRVVAENPSATRFTGITVRFLFGAAGLEQTYDRTVASWDPRAFLDTAVYATTNQSNPNCRVAFYRSNGQIEIPSAPRP